MLLTTFSILYFNIVQSRDTQIPYFKTMITSTNTFLWYWPILMPYLYIFWRGWSGNFLSHLVCCQLHVFNISSFSWQHDHKRSIFVGNLPYGEHTISCHLLFEEWNITDEQSVVSLKLDVDVMTDVMELPLREYFEECGEVQAVRLVRDKDSGIGKGFGYILFEVQVIFHHDPVSLCS